MSFAAAVFQMAMVPGTIDLISSIFHLKKDCSVLRRCSIVGGHVIATAIFYFIRLPFASRFRLPRRPIEPA
jgi:hypothetical protein